MRLYIIRHGDPDYTTDRFTEIGQREAQALAEAAGKRAPYTHL